MSFKIGGVRIKVSFLFFAMLTMVFVIDEKKIALIMLVSVALHELGHIIALLLFGNYPDEINFGIFGIRIQQNKYILSELKQAVVVFCGPLVNIAIFAVFLIADFIFDSQILLLISAVNLVMGVFNLLPISNLDGGRILSAVLNAFLPDEFVCRIMRAICVVLLFFLIFLGVFLAIKTRGNFSLLVTGIYLCILCVKSIRI